MSLDVVKSQLVFSPPDVWKTQDKIEFYFGIPFQFILEYATDYEEYKCSVCDSLPWEPVLCQECSRIFCSSCLQRILFTTEGNCPLCSYQFFGNALPHEKDSFIKQSQIRCYFQNNGCKAITLQSNFQSHIESCHYRTRVCKKCHYDYLQRDIEKHSEFCTIKQKEVQVFSDTGNTFKSTFQIDGVLKRMEIIEQKNDSNEQRIFMLEQMLAKAIDKIEYLEKEKLVMSDFLTTKKHQSQEQAFNAEESSLLIYNEVQASLQQSNVHHFQIPATENCQRVTRKIHGNQVVFKLTKEEKGDKGALIGATFDLSTELPALSNYNYFLTCTIQQLQGLSVIGFQINDNVMLNISNQGEFSKYFPDGKDDSLWNGQFIGNEQFGFGQGDEIEIMYNSSTMVIYLTNITQKTYFFLDIAEYIMGNFQDSIIQLQACLYNLNDTLVFGQPLCFIFPCNGTTTTKTLFFFKFQSSFAQKYLKSIQKFVIRSQKKRFVIRSQQQFYDRIDQIQQKVEKQQVELNCSKLIIQFVTGEVIQRLPRWLESYKFDIIQVFIVEVEFSLSIHRFIDILVQNFKVGVGICRVDQQSYHLCFKILSLNSVKFNIPDVQYVWHRNHLSIAKHVIYHTVVLLQFIDTQTPRYQTYETYYRENNECPTNYLSYPPPSENHVEEHQTSQQQTVPKVEEENAKPRKN